MWSNPQYPADLAIFTEEILEISLGLLHFVNSIFVSPEMLPGSLPVAKIKSFTTIVIHSFYTRGVP